MRKQNMNMQRRKASDKLKVRNVYSFFPKEYPSDLKSLKFVLYVGKQG